MNTEVTVPLLDLRAQYTTIKAQIDKAIRGVLETQRFIMGPEVASLEEEIASYCDTRFAIGCASGSDALLLAMMALGIGPGDEVICPSYTFFATAGSIARLGAVPVFADIDPVTYNVEAESVRQASTRCSRLKAIMPVHLFGQTVDMSAYLALGEELGVPIIEDAAQAIGSRDSDGKPAGSRGRIGCFSFFPSKNLGSFGDAGILTTNDADLAQRLSTLRLHGSKPKYYHKMIGINSRLDALQAVVLRVKLRHIDAWHEGRRENAETYDGAFAAAGAVTSVVPLTAGGFPLRTPQPPSGEATHIYNQYVIRVPAGIRDALRQQLQEQRIGTEIYYPVPLHLQECFAYLGYAQSDLPESESAAQESLALPIYPELSDEQLAHVAETVIAYVGEHAYATKA